MLQHDEGLVTATLAANDHLAWKALECRKDLHVVNVAPPPASGGEWLTEGFRFRPTNVLWLADPKGSEEEYIEGLGHNPRYAVRKALRDFQASTMTLEHVEKITHALAVEWLPLYRESLDGMAFATPVVNSPEEVVGIGPDVEMLVIRDAHGNMCAGMVALNDHRRGVYTAGLYGERSGLRSHNLSRVLYLALINVTRAHGMPVVSAGWEPNLYGHIAKAGLAAYKRSLGFRPVPRAALRADGSEDVLTRVVHDEGLAPPVVFFAYPTWPPEQADLLDVRLRAVVHPNTNTPFQLSAFGSDVESLSLAAADKAAVR
ncbi:MULTISPECIES: hypothetical protein [unclassified Streptomyces]|uniref:hypothetical protein n=1 Tax=unclassified Streptomyces TaxID=2593676 RepID=UPI002366E2C6|nr:MULTISPECIES: hypothetical protein [unclassified Streptomyces]MDF3140215.1 hypothetical protein [Streptomyces sp. T21Q-yed]WDF38210.1 hypothetical protein PBV52_16105 [Streptomyces sp. T12]